MMEEEKLGDVVGPDRQRHLVRAPKQISVRTHERLRQSRLFVSTRTCFYAKVMWTPETASQRKLWTVRQTTNARWQWEDERKLLARMGALELLDFSSSYGIGRNEQRRKRRTGKSKMEFAQRGKC